MMNSPDTFFDAIVIGGGIAGAATTDALARRGQKVLLIEQFEPGHTRGSSHGDGRIIRVAYPESIYVEMALLAYPMWEELSQRAGRALVQTTGGWDSGPADSPQLSELESNFQRFGITYERLSAAASNRRFPHFRLDEGSEAIVQADAGVVFATPAVQALWRLARAGGAATVTGERVVGLEPVGEQIRVRGASGICWTSPRLVITAGGWANHLLAQIGLRLPVQVTQEQVAFFPPADDLDHRAGAMPVFIDYHTTDLPFYGLPEIEVPGVKIGAHHAGQPIDPDYPRPWDEANFAILQQFVRERFPHLQSAPTTQLTCLYTNTTDYHFILDRHPELPNVVIGSACSGHGFKFGPVLGAILAALTLDETPPVSLESFSLERFADEETLIRRTGA